MAARGTDGLGLTALLLIAVLVPTGFLLWFMYETATSQAAAARQGVFEAYRGQLRLVRERVDTHWRSHAVMLRVDGDPEPLFAHLVMEHRADGVVLLDENGFVAYPQCCDAGTRVVAADRQLRALQEMNSGDPRFADRVDALAARLNDYDDPMPSPQRLFLMGELRTLAPGVTLPTESALRLSIEIVERGTPPAVADGFTPAAPDGIWSLASPDRGVIAFYRTGRIQSMMNEVLDQVEVEGVRFLALPPGAGSTADAIAAGPTLPGWQLTYSLLDPTAIDNAAQQRAMLYLWVGFAGIVLIAAVGITAARVFGRHLRLARLKTDLVAAVSHELRTPLASMRVLVDGLLADREIDPVKTREYLAMMATENARLSRLLDNFLAFSRLERRRQQFTLAAVCPAGIVQAAIEAVRERVPASCALRVDIGPELPSITADADALTTALVNLLDNALKYTPADKRIAVRAQREGKFVVFSVEDNGIGIPVREQRRIFRRFYRVDQRLASNTTGVGLGLSIVELIVRAHGGTVTVRSETSAGSTFTLRVPCAADASAAGAPA